MRGELEANYVLINVINFRLNSRVTLMPVDVDDVIMYQPLLGVKGFYCRTKEAAVNWKSRKITLYDFDACSRHALSRVQCTTTGTLMRKQRSDWLRTFPIPLPTPPTWHTQKASGASLIQVSEMNINSRCCRVVKYWRYFLLFSSDEGICVDRYTGIVTIIGKRAKHTRFQNRQVEEKQLQRTNGTKQRKNKTAAATMVEVRTTLDEMDSDGTLRRKDAGWRSWVSRGTFC